MPAPTLAETAAHLGVSATDPKVQRALAEAVELLTLRLATAYAAADQARPATFRRIHLDVAKELYERGRTKPAQGVAPVRGFTAAAGDPLDVVASDLELLDTQLLPGVG